MKVCNFHVCIYSVIKSLSFPPEVFNPNLKMICNTFYHSDCNNYKFCDDKGGVSMQEIIIKIGKETNYMKAAKSIYEQFSKEVTVKIDAIGIAANYTAIKALIQVRKDLSTNGMLIAFLPSYINLSTDSGEKTAVRWEVISVK
jgi:stage V sporulation protein SpoVS